MPGARRDFVQSAVSGAVLVATPSFLRAAGADAGAGGDKAAVLAQIPEAARREPQATAELDRAAVDRRGEPQLSAGRRIHDEARGRGRLHRPQDHPDFRQARRVRATRCRREEHARRLFHVRREAVRARGVEFAAARGAPGRQAGPRHGHHGPRRREPEGSGECLPCRARRVQGQRQEAAGEPGADLRRRGGDRLAALRRDRRQSRRAAAREALHRRAAAECLAGAGRQRHRRGRRQGHLRNRTGLERREVGSRPEEGHPLQPRGAGRFALMAPGAGAQHAGREGRAHARGDGLLREGAAAVRRAEEDGARIRSDGARGHASRPSTASSAGSRTRTGRLRCCACTRSPRSTSRAWSAATPARAARRCCRTARSPRSTCAWCPT